MTDFPAPRSAPRFERATAAETHQALRSAATDLCDLLEHVGGDLGAPDAPEWSESVHSAVAGLRAITAPESRSSVRFAPWLKARASDVDVMVGSRWVPAADLNRPIGEGWASLIDAPPGLTLIVRDRS